jgi:hypothetical protein
MLTAEIADHRDGRSLRVGTKRDAAAPPNSVMLIRRRTN